MSYANYWKLNPINTKINFTSLDCLRGLAAVYVLITHARPHLYAGGEYLKKIKPIKDWSLFEKIYIGLCQCTRLGYEFVIFFFILSGFSIAFSIHRSNNLFNFYRRRLIRIYPPYLLGVFWAMIVFLLLKEFAPLWIYGDPNNHTSLSLGNISNFLEVKNIINNIFYSPHGILIVQYWSLPHEIIFYLLIPIFIKSIKSYLIVSVVIYLLCIPFNGITYIGYKYKSIDFILHYNFYFAIGVYLYYFKDFLVLNVWLSKFKIYFISTFLIIFLLMTVIKIFLLESNFITEIMASILSVISIKYFLNTNYTPKLLVFFGKFSYTIYVVHFASLILFKLLLHLLFNYDGSEITNKYIWILGTVFALANSYLFYFIGEKPAKDYLEKIRK